MSPLGIPPVVTLAIAVALLWVAGDRFGRVIQASLLLVALYLGLAHADKIAELAARTLAGLEALLPAPPSTLPRPRPS